jgi:hypothetical protein
MSERASCPDEMEPSAARLAGLVAEYYEALAGDIRKDRDGHWQISCRWSYGELLGWFVEHDGYRYQELEGEYGEDGPHPSYTAAVACMEEHLRAAISQARDSRGG